MQDPFASRPLPPRMSSRTSLKIKEPSSPASINTYGYPSPSPSMHGFDTQATTGTLTPGTVMSRLESLLVAKSEEIQLAGRLGESLLSQQAELERKIQDLEHAVLPLGSDGERVEYDDATQDIGQEIKSKLEALESDMRQWDADNEVFYGQIGQASSLSRQPSTNGQEPETDLKSAQASRRAKRDQLSSSRANDIEFATEIGQSLLTEVRRLQALLQQSEETISEMAREKEGLAQALESKDNAMRSLEESVDRYKEENWNLEVSLQELKASHTELVATSARTESERAKLAKSLAFTRTEAESQRQEIEQLSKAMDEVTARRELDLAEMRKGLAGLQREKSDLQGHLEKANTELAKTLAKRSISGQIAKSKSGGQLLDSMSPHKGEAPDYEDAEEPQDEDDVFGQPPTSVRKRKTGDGLALLTTPDDFFSSDGEAITPDGSPAVQRDRSRFLDSAAKDQTDLKTKLAHATRTIATLRNALAREKGKKGDGSEALDEPESDGETSPAKMRMAAGRGGGRRGRGRRGAFRGGVRSNLAVVSTDWQDDEDASLEADSSIIDHGEDVSDEEGRPQTRFAPSVGSIDGMDPAFANLSGLESTGNHFDLSDDKSIRPNSGMFESNSSITDLLKEAKRQAMDMGTTTNDLRKPVDTLEVACQTDPIEPLVRIQVEEKLVYVPQIQIQEKIVERIVEVPKIEERIVERIVEVPKIEERVVEKIVEKIIEVPKVEERIVERIVEVPVDRVVERLVEVPRVEERVVENIVERIVEVPTIEERIVEKTVEVPVDRIVERIVEVPKVDERIVEKIVEVQLPPQIVEKIVHVPQIQEKIVEKIVEVPTTVEVERVVEKIVYVPQIEERIVEKIVEVPKIEERVVERIVEVPKIEERIVERIVEKIVEVPKIQERIVEVEKLVEVPKIVEKIVEVEKIVYLPAVQPDTADSDSQTPPVTTAASLFRAPSRPKNNHNRLSQLEDLRRHAGAANKGWNDNDSMTSADDGFHTGQETEAGDTETEVDFEDARETIGARTPALTMTPTQSTLDFHSFRNGSPSPQITPSARQTRPSSYFAEAVLSRKETVDQGCQTDLVQEKPVALPEPLPPPVASSAASLAGDSKRDSQASTQTFGVLHPDAAPGLRSSVLTITPKHPEVSSGPVYLRAINSHQSLVANKRSSAASHLTAETTSSGNSRDAQPSMSREPPIISMPPPPTAPPPMPSPRKAPRGSSVSTRPPRPISPAPADLLQRAQTPLGDVMSSSNPFAATPSYSALRGKLDPYDNMPQSARSTMNSRRSKAPSFASRGSINSAHSRGHSFDSGHTSEGGFRPDNDTMPGHDLSGTDPDVIHAITQTMIGEFMYKYKRRMLGGGISEKRHRRFFWIHPYTRTLYWSPSDPGNVRVNQSASKGVYIVTVRQVIDANPQPPGLHQHSIMVTTMDREIKITAPTHERHKLWFDALEYLVQRPAGDEVKGDSPRSVATKGSIKRKLSSPSLAGPSKKHPMYAHGSQSESRLLSQKPRTRMSTSTMIQRRPNTPGTDFGSPRSIRSYGASTLHSNGTSEYADVDDSVDFGDDDDDADDGREGYEGLENVRVCCGEHDVGHLAHKRHHHRAQSKSSSISVFRPKSPFSDDDNAAAASRDFAPSLSSNSSRLGRSSLGGLGSMFNNTNTSPSKSGRR